jgi:type I restriction enzyme S subunit
MSTELLLKHFSSIADLPNAVEKLRKYVLSLALRGKLSSPEPQDESVLELLKRLPAENSQLSRGTKHVATEQVPSKTDPYELPRNWSWVPFGKLHRLVRGVTYTESDTSNTPAAGYIAVLRASNIGRTLTHDDPVYVRRECVGSNQFLREGDFLIALSSGSKNLVGKAAFVPRDYDEAFGGFCGAIRLLIPELRPYASIYLQSDLYRSSISAESRGIGINNLKKEMLLNLRFPLPPVAEQWRIVAKVDELMALCDRLEKAQAERETRRDKLAAATLARISTPNAKTFRNDAHFALDNLQTLTTRPDQIQLVRRAILNLAVQGKLVDQDPSDPPASQLLERISEERAELVRAKAIRRESPLSPIEADEWPFVVPSGWTLARIGEAVIFTQYGTSQKSSGSRTGVPVLTMGNIQNGSVVYGEEKTIPKDCDDLPALFLDDRDILYNRTNSAELVGKTGIYVGESGIRTFASYLIRLKPSLRWTNPHYINLAMNATVFRDSQITPLIKKQTGQANVNGTALKNMVIPLPPLPEQQRIVKRVEELMSLSDDLGKVLSAGESVRSSYLELLLTKSLESPMPAAIPRYVDPPISPSNSERKFQAT